MSLSKDLVLSVPLLSLLLDIVLIDVWLDFLLVFFVMVL